MPDSIQEDEEIESFVVRKTGYYRDKWNELHEKPGSTNRTPAISIESSSASFHGVWCRGAMVPVMTDL